MANAETRGDEVTLVSWNIKKGERVDAACDWINEQNPDVVLWQEMQANDFLHAQARLRMRGYPAAKTSTSGNDNVIFLHDDGLFAVTDEHLHPWSPWHAPANVSVRMRGDGAQLSPRTLSLVCEHSCYWSADHRKHEADWYTTLAKDGWLAIGAVDWNGYPEDEAPDDDSWKHVADRAFYVNRTWLAEDGSRRTDDRADLILRAAGYIDAARWATDHLGQTDALTPTAGHGKEKQRQGGPSRIDRAYLSSELGPAIKHFRIGDTPSTREISDHLPAVLVLRRHVLTTTLNRPT